MKTTLIICNHLHTCEVCREQTATDILYVYGVGLLGGFILALVLVDTVKIIKRKIT